MRFLAVSVTSVAAACAVFAGCNAPPPPAKQPVVADMRPPTPPPESCVRSASAVSVLPVDTARLGSSVVLGKMGDRTFAYVADEDERSVVVVDAETGKPTARVDLEGRPSQLLLLADGRLVVGMRDRASVAVYETRDATGALGRRCSVPVAAEPVAFAVSPDDATLLVTSGWGRRLTALDTKDLGKKWDVAVPREPRAVAITDDGKKAYVAHAVGGQLTAIDLASPSAEAKPVVLHGDDPENTRAELRKVKNMADAKERARRAMLMGQNRSTRASCQGFALAKSVDPGGRILAPQVLVEPGDPRQRPTGYGADNDQTEFPDVAVVDAVTGEAMAASLERTDQRMLRQMRGDATEHLHEECLLPRAAAYDAKSRSLLVSCLGVDQIVAYDAASANPARAEKARWDVAAGPTGIAIDAANRRAFVWSQFDRVLDRVPLGGLDAATDKPAPVARFSLPSDAQRALPMSVALGRLLFHEVGDARMSHDGRACASCHPDGRDDSLVWATPEGPRRSIMLAGRVAATAPYSWSGTENTLHEHLDITFQRLKGAGGLKSLELDALAAYVSSLAAPPAQVDGTSNKVLRGREIFASTEAACATCHTGADGTDNKRHDVGSKTSPDRSAEFNTPSLRFVGGTGPYFHDGRYKTLKALLKESDGKMGKTSHLSADDLDALETYLRSL